MTALTTAQLDELERKARGAAGAGWSTAHAYCDDVLRLVAIARAALAWNRTRIALIEATDAHEDREDDASLAALRKARKDHDVADLVKALRGTP